jgi:hypothetical protein
MAEHYTTCWGRAFAPSWRVPAATPISWVPEFQTYLIVQKIYLLCFAGAEGAHDPHGKARMDQWHEGLCYRAGGNQNAKVSC